jgi:hypothetical protein
MATQKKDVSEQRGSEHSTLHLVLEVLDQQVREHELNDEWGKARKVVEKAKDRFQNMPRGKLRKRYLDELERRHYLYFWGEIIPEEVKQAVARENADSEDEDRLWEMLLGVSHPDLRGDPYD